MRVFPGGEPLSPKVSIVKSSWVRWASTLLVASYAAILAVGATRASPGIDVAANDLTILQRWQSEGRLTSHPTDSSHLTKPGYIAVLRLLLPSRGASASENRRFLFVNAAFLLAGAGFLGSALARHVGPSSGFFFLAFLVLLLPLRDGADYVGSEAIASGLAMLAAAFWILGRSGGRAWLSAAGVVGALLTTIRPNVGLLLVALALALGGGELRPKISPRTAGLAFGATLVALLALLRAAGDRTHTLEETSRTALWGTADYYWRFDVGTWPDDPDPLTSTRLQLAKTTARWRASFRPFTENRARSLEWRAFHGLFSADELPPRWRAPRYLAWDAAVRRWWWLGAVLVVALSAGAAVGGRNAHRWTGLLVVAFVVAQSLAFGADPRLALPALPLAGAGVAAALPSFRRSTRSLAVALAVGALLTWRLARIPDVADYDFALVRGPGQTIEELLPPGRVPAAPRLLHFRLLQEPPFAAGFVASVDGRVVLRRETGDPSPVPAFFTAALTEDEAQRARRSGLRLTLTTLPAANSDSFVYFPASPPALGLSCQVDGSDRIPSAFFGQTRGGWPVWVTPD